MAIGYIQFAKLRRLCSLANNLRIRNAERKDLPEVAAIMEAEGQLFDQLELAFMWEVDPSFLFVVEKDGREITGFASIINYGQQFSSGGFLIAKKEYRGSSLVGKMLLREGIRRIRSSNIIRHEEYHDKLYLQDGPFKPFLECNYLEAVGRPCIHPTTGSKRQNAVNAGIVNIVDPSNVSLYDILAYDTGIHTVPRERYIKTLLKWPFFKTRLALDGNENIIGYGTLRSIPNWGYYLAPLYADSIEIARLLYENLSKSCETNANIYAIVPSANTNATQLLTDLSMDVVHKCYRLSSRPTGIPLDKVYCPASVDCTLA